MTNVPAHGRPVRVLIVDDDRHFRHGLRAALDAADVQVVGEATNGLEAVQQADSLQPDVVVLDVHMPGVDGIAAARSLAEHAPHVRVLVLTVSDAVEDLAQASRAGAAGYLLKERSLSEIASAVRSVAAGQHWPLAAS